MKYLYININMDLVLDPEIYSPSIDINGNYNDCVPPTSVMKNGIKCPCGGSRKDTVFNSCATFTKHTKTITHQKWIENMNNNKQNYYVEYNKLKKTIENQQKLLIEKDNIINQKDIVIHCLSKELDNERKKRTVDTDLIDFIN